MYLEVKLAMNKLINNKIDEIKNYLNDNPKLKEWCWFVFLWCSGLIAVSSVAYLIRLIIL